MRLMVQSLLADGFKLALRFERQQVPVFVLTLVKPEKLGPEIRPHAEGRPCPAKRDSELVPRESDPDVWPPSCGSVAFALGSELMRFPQWKKASAEDDLIAGRDVSLEQLVGSLMRLAVGGRPIVDQTGLTGNFDFRLEWTPEPGFALWEGLLGGTTAQRAEFQRSTFLEALKEQFGMKLEATKAVIPVLVIDHVEKPSEN
jgi:bla regulator protein blaR1